MKKTININLGGQPFIIDEQAYDILHHYFEALKQKFTNENEQREILSDIEARVAEILTQRLGKIRAVVNEEDVVYVISLMGKPEDIAGEPESAASDTNSNTIFSTPPAGPVDKKFFRDPDNKKVGGIISGLCHYFGWGDPTWIRIAIVGLVVLSQFVSLHLGVPIVIIYLILLIVVPEASTSAEKLQMRGQPVTIQNIEKEVRDAMTTAGKSFNAMVKDTSATGRLSSAIMMILRATAKIFLVFVIMICVLLMIALAGSFFGLSVLSSSSLSEITQLVVSSRYTIMLFNVGLLLAIGIPLVSIMYDAIRFLTNSQVKNPVLKRVLWVFWFIGILLLGVTSWRVFNSFAVTDSTTQKVQLLSPRNGTLKVQLADTMGNMLALKNSDDEQFSSFINIDGMTRTDYGFGFRELKLEIAVSPDSNFYVERVTTSHGASFADANKNIQMLHYKFSQNDTTLNLDDKFEIPKLGKWRAQKLKIRVYVPEGKRVTFADNTGQVETSVKGNEYFNDELPGKTLQVVSGKIKCLDCKEKVINNEDEDAPEAPETEDSITSVNVQSKGKNINISSKGINVTRTDTIKVTSK